MSYAYEKDECIHQICHTDDEKVHGTISNEDKEGPMMKPVVNKQENRGHGMENARRCFKVPPVSS